jgi:hypothetical protein
MTARSRTGLTLDAGALIAVERNVRPVIALLERARAHGLSFAIPAGVLGQVWRDGGRQARLARLLATEELEIEVLDDLRARTAGQLCGVTRTDDVIDASVVLCARARGHRIVTSDPDDLAQLAPDLELIVV